MMSDTRIGCTRFIRSRTKLARSCFRGYLKVDPSATMNHDERGFRERTAETLARCTARGYQSWHEHCDRDTGRGLRGAHGPAREINRHGEKGGASDRARLFRGGWAGSGSIGAASVKVARCSSTSSVRRRRPKPVDASLRKVVFFT